MGLKFSNFARALLAIPPSGTTGLSFTVEAGKGALFPALGTGDYTYVLLKNSLNQAEYVKVSARTGDTFTIEAGGRGYDATTPRSWTAGDEVKCVLPAGALTEIFDASGAVTQLNAHLSDPTAAHAASAIAFSPAGTLSATTVQAALAELDTEKLPIAGGTMTGALVLNGNASAALQAVPKQQLDAAIVQYLPLAGGTVVGSTAIIPAASNALALSLTGKGNQPALSALAGNSADFAIVANAAKAPFGYAVGGYTQSGSIYGALGYDNVWSFYGNGPARATTVVAAAGTAALETTSTGFLVGSTTDIALLFATKTGKYQDTESFNGTVVAGGAIDLASPGRGAGFYSVYVGGVHVIGAYFDGLNAETASFSSSASSTMASARYLLNTTGSNITVSLRRLSRT